MLESADKHYLAKKYNIEALFAFDCIEDGYKYNDRSLFPFDSSNLRIIFSMNDDGNNQSEYLPMLSNDKSIYFDDESNVNKQSLAEQIKKHHTMSRQYGIDLNETDDTNFERLKSNDFVEEVMKEENEATNEFLTIFDACFNVNGWKLSNAFIQFEENKKVTIHLKYDRNYFVYFINGFAVIFGISLLALIVCMHYVFGKNEEFNDDQRIMSLLFILLILMIFNGNLYNFTSKINHFEVTVMDKYILINYVFLCLLIIETCLISSDFFVFDDLDVGVLDKMIFQCLSGIFVFYNIIFVIYCYSVRKKGANSKKMKQQMNF